MSAFLDRLQKEQQLPSLPAAAIQVLRLAQRDDASAEDIAAVIERDPALTARLLKVVNSSLFRVSRNVTSVRQAVVILGLRSVKVLTLGFSVIGAMKSDAEGTFDYRQFWRRSLTLAAAGRQLSRRTSPVLADESFVAGLLADLGILAAFRGAPREYAPVLELARQSGRPLWEVELDVLGVHHGVIGATLLRRWGIPDLLCHAVEHHHDPTPDALPQASRSLGIVTQAASRLADVFCGDERPERLPDIRARVIADLGMTHDQIEPVLDALDEQVRETAAMLNLSVGDTISYAQLQAEAMNQMAQLTLQAEIDRADSLRRAETARLLAEQLEREKKAILDMASTDSITQISNRAAFDQRLEEEWERARVAGASLALILADIDYFKQINDTHGHSIGDVVLLEVAQTLHRGAQGEGFVARYGGEEFAVILADTSDVEAAQLAQRLRKAVASIEVLHQGVKVRVTASFGVASIIPNGESRIKALVDAADQALYQAKRRGRNRVETASTGDTTNAAAQVGGRSIGAPTGGGVTPPDRLMSKPTTSRV